MRILIKGGVWKNTEDEILKAAVMKYGLNQWARISSLLTRKSAKQCKARWYEWLDPAIRKTEWTREEDEKLLHLAKLMPTQWRTIAPIVGRTPAQCLERYEKLLDMAAGKESYDPTDDPRRLRPGEIDPNPESKPARPDPIDMDEDEKEMLSEARARLANTKGKKAKRKARERQLEEARRLATLQKKRELKAAGIEVRERFRRGGAIDYGKEVPFERRPAPGFYDTVEERDRTQEMREEFRPVTVDELEGRKRKDIEKELIKQDIAKHKLAERADTPAALARALAANEGPQGPVRRGKLMLPTPGISDAELEELARGGGSAAAVEEEMRASGSAATRGLLNDYSTPRPGTGLRTPAPSVAAGSQTSRLMQEAANLKALVTGATPLLGGENPSLEGSDFSGVTPFTAATPALAGVGVGATPVRAEETGKFGATPRSTSGNRYAPTPVRDALGLNADEAAAASKREELARMSLQRNDLRAGLAQLPGPKNEYQVMIPELAPEDAAAEAARKAEMGGTAAFEEDAADAAARNAREAAEEKAAELRRASRVVQRGLPRPTVSQQDHELLDDESAPIKERAEALIVSELTRMLQYEQRKFPDNLSHANNRSNTAKKRKKSSSVLSDESKLGGNLSNEFEVDPSLMLDEELLAQAAALLEKETAIVRAGTGHEATSDDQVAASLREATDDIIFLPSTQRFARRAGATAAERLEALRYAHGHVRRAMAREAQRADKLRARGELLTRGLEAREGRLMAEAQELARDLASKSINLACFRELLAREERATPERLEAVATMVQAQEAKETALQVRYRAAGDALAELRRVPVG